MIGTTRIVRWRGVAAAELRAGSTTAVVVPELGMLVASWRVGDAELVARPGGVAAVRAGHTTAVPLLYPWANRLARRSYAAAGRTVSLRGLPLHTDGNGLPIHGTMAAQPAWTIAAAGRGRLRARFDFGARPDLLASFPFPHELEVAVSVAPGRLTVETTVIASGGCAVPVSFGWHPYWQLPSPRRRWSVQLAPAGHIELDRRGLPTGRVAAPNSGPRSLASAAFDDLFRFVADRRVALTDGEHRLDLELDGGYPYCQIYAPPDARFCCLEPMTAPTNALVTGDHQVVAAGDSFSGRFRASFTSTGSRGSSTRASLAAR